MNDSASVTSSSLAIAEKSNRTNGGCVGIIFQLFDWNRRFSKKKLFSKRLLPPDVAKEGSKKFGGDDKLPRLRLIADENSGGFPNKNKNGDNNGVQTPSLVARLMGLESMPPANRDQLQKDDSCEKETSSPESRPQKVQKTGMADRRSVSRFGAEALQLKNVLSQSRKHHYSKLASPVKGTASHQAKRNTSRLIGAATRILEPGLQARNKSRYAITYGQGARKPLGNRSQPVKGEASCRNCGSLIDIAESTSVFDSLPNGNNSRYDQQQGVSIDRGQQQLTNQHPPLTYVKEDNLDQLKFNCFPFSSNAEDYVALNRGLSGRIRSRVPGKGENMKFESGHVNCLSPRQKRQATHARSGSFDNIPGMVSNPQSTVKQTGPDAWQPDYHGQIRNKNSDDGAPFRFSSPVKNRYEVPIKVKLERSGRKNPNASPCKPTSRKRFTSFSSDEKRRLQKPFPSTVVGYESGINGTPPKRTPRKVFIMEKSLAQNDRKHDHCTSFCLQPMKPEKVEGLIRGKNSDHLSPGSVLEASFSYDSCCSSSLEDSSGKRSIFTFLQHSMSYSYDDESQFQESETDPFCPGLSSRKENTHNKLATDLLTYISQVLCSMDLVNFRINRSIKEVIFNSELVLSNQMPHNPNEINSFFICDLLLELDTLADTMWTTFGNFLGSLNSNAGYQMKHFVFDSLMEYLESRYVPYSKCGFRAWMNLPRFMGFDTLVHEFVEEVRRWMGVTQDEQLVEMEMSHGSGKWSDYETEAYETSAKLEWDIIQMLIDETVIDISTGNSLSRV
ncbi:hypothetical protein SSX86_016324 [Deinandra increscens subsp. villosa]|uniref:DUF4378 domain-containing protein n=1 Tax=Deinandra increscens subsp. villosa TaxID=3103831 RepID=A0AAP0CZF6_9ASTR